MPFLMIRNDITKVAADAIVNPANRNLLQGSGTSRAIYQAAGEQELTAACEDIGRCDLGRAVCTPAFGLPAKYIFHAVCPAWHGGFFGEAKQLAGAYHSALELAAEYHCESVAFPLLSSGNYGYPKEQAFRIAVDTITQYVMEHDLTVYLVLYDRDSLAVSRKLFASVEEYIDDHYVAQNDESYGFGRRRRELSERRRLLEEDAALPMLGAVPAPAAAPRTARSLESLMDNLGESFTTQGSGTSRAIYQAAGEQELTAACEDIGRCDLGRAVCTPAFGLPAKYIFHAVCPAWHGGFFGEAKQLAGAYHSALELAAEYHCESVAFPLLSSGNYGYPKEQAFRIAVDTITQYVMEHDLTVYLVLYDRDSLAVSRKLFASVEEYIDDHYVAQNDESYGFGRRRRELSERRRLLEEDAALPMLGAVPAPAAAPRTARSLESLMDNLGESFTTRLLRLIDERGLKDSTVYKQSNISRQHFSKIQCNRDYNPKKKTVLAFAVGLHLSEDETIDLLKSAGYAFSDGSKRDWIVRYCLEHKIYNINQVNTLLFEYDQEQLGA